MKIAYGGKLWVLFSILISLVFLIFYVIFRSYEAGFIFLLLSAIFLLVFCFFIVFFRDPDRLIGDGIVACADGRITEIKNIDDKEIENCLRISTFMNIHNVHVNRMPLDGKVIKIIHKHGFHLPAFNKESEKNERVIISIKTDIGLIKIIQIAGTLARRIYPYIKNEDNLKKGEKIGIIRLGSRVDVYLPLKKIKNVKVKVGDIIKAGEGIIAEIND